MNIQKIMLYRALRQYGLFFAGVGVAMLGQHVYESTAISEIRMEILKKYPDRYFQIKQDAEKISVGKRKQYWNKALNSLNDSANTSQAYKTYFEGLQLLKNNKLK